MSQASDPRPSARLHLLLSSSAAAWADCAAQHVDGDFILLVDAGAGLLADADALGHLRAVAGERLGVTTADARALGLADLAPGLGIRSLGDDDWVRLLADHGQVLSWR